jgi:diazepam-binding inhibitor (GABA receptor modulator, acyl-CoA-binding protein)
MSNLVHEFEQATEDALRLPEKPDNETLLKLYSFYKQATEGDVHGKRPGFTNPVGRAKFDAWKKVKGKSTEEAMTAYIAQVSKLKE